MRGAQEILDRFFPRMFFSQKGFIRRIFQQAADEIRHAGNQFSNRRVNPHAASGLGDGGLERLGHTEEHLIFIGLGPKADGLSERFGMRQTAKIMRAERRPNHIALLNQHAAEPLIIGIRVGLRLKHRDRPAALLGENHFGVPVRALDQSYGDRSAALPNPFNQSI